MDTDKEKDQSESNQENSEKLGYRLNVDSLGLLAESASRDRNDSDEDGEPEDDEGSSPDSAPSPDRDANDEFDNEPQCEDDSNLGQNDNEIDINEDFVLEYHEEDKANQISSNEESNIPSSENLILNVISLANDGDVPAKSPIPMDVENEKEAENVPDVIESNKASEDMEVDVPVSKDIPIESSIVDNEEKSESCEKMNITPDEINASEDNTEKAAEVEGTDSLKKSDNDVIDLSDDEAQKQNKTSTHEVPEFKPVNKHLNQVLDILEIDGSSSDSDGKISESKMDEFKISESREDGTTTVCIPSSIEVTASKADDNVACNTNDSGASVISGLPSSPPKSQPAMRINTSEITILSVAKNSESAQKTTEDEIFNIDSDEEETQKPDKPSVESNESSNVTKDEITNDIEMKSLKDVLKSTCVNPNCKNNHCEEFSPCPLFVLGMYKIKKVKQETHPMICKICLDSMVNETEQMISSFKSGAALINVDVTPSDDAVEVLDSDSDVEDNDNEEYFSYSNNSPIPEEEINFISENLSNVMEEVCTKFDLDKQINICSDLIMKGVQKLEDETLELKKEIDALQANTTFIRKELYDNIKIKKQFLPELLIPMDIDESEDRSRRGFNEKPDRTEHLCSEAIQNSRELPPPGPLKLPGISVGHMVYTVKKSLFGAWIPSVVIEFSPAGTIQNGSLSAFSLLGVRYFVNGRQAIKQVSGRQVAYFEPAKVRYPIGTRVIALFKDGTVLVKKDAYYSGIVAEAPSSLNKFRYLIFFDDGYSQYVTHSGILPMFEGSENVWDDVHPDSREFIKKYLSSFPDRPMVRMQPGQMVRTEKHGTWWDAKVIALDASLALVRFQLTKARDEWIYRGSTRLAILFQQLQVADRRAHAPGRHRPTGTSMNLSTRTGVPYVEYTRTDQDGAPTKSTEDTAELETRQKPQRAVARKSSATSSVTATAQTTQRVEDLTPEIMDSAHNQVKSRVVYYSPKTWIHPEKMVPHVCSSKCQSSKALPLKELRTYNPLARPLLSAWERLIVKYRQKRTVMYRAPCGRRLRTMEELHKYLLQIESPMGVDLFDFDYRVHCLAEFVLMKCLVNKPDISHGVEAVPVPCVNYYDHSLPEFWAYSTQRQPIAGVNLNLDEDFLCACDCTDDCQDKAKCQCWRLTYEGAKFIGMEIEKVGYQHKRLLDPCPTGIYECNSRCKCRNTCLNKVVQHPLQLKLQVFKTFNKGWGIKALNDIPRGSFICIYAGNLLTDAVANMDGGINEGDKYLADLDYIEVVERLKECYEADVPEADKILDNPSNEDSQNESSEPSEPEDEPEKNDSDDEFNPIYPLHHDPFVKTQKRNLRPRKRQTNKNEPVFKLKIPIRNAYEADADVVKSNLSRELESNPNISTIDVPIEFEFDQPAEKPVEVKIEPGTRPRTVEEDLITISDDEEVLREPSRFAAPEGCDEDEYIPRHRSVRSFYGEDEACYIMDARVRGNIGRYLNHSCSPNVFVQNVFVDTHDPRFPWVAFFALEHIRAGTELTWNYNYDIGSVPGKIIYCRCGASNCRGRLL